MNTTHSPLFTLVLCCLLAAVSACGDSESDSANSGVSTGSGSSTTGGFFNTSSNTSGTTGSSSTATSADAGGDTTGGGNTGTDAGTDTSTPDVPPPDPCDPNPCMNPPANFCQSEGAVVVQYNPEGACSPIGEDDFECTYSTTTTDCIGLGLVCQSGACVDPEAPAPSPGDIVINEIMFDPHYDLAEESAEWVELTNVTATDYALDGCTLSDDGGNSASLDGVIVPAGGFAVLAKSQENNGGIVVDGTFGFNLGNTGDSVILTCASGEIDRVVYDDTYPAERARSLSLEPSATSTVGNDNPENWCAGSTVYYDGSAGNDEDNYGTPGAPNPVCPEPVDPCAPNPCTAPPAATCDGNTVVSYADQGTCTPDGEEAICTYTPSTQDCAANGQLCVFDRCEDEVPPEFPPPTAGQVIVTEVMYDPHYDLSEDNGEWVELTNLSNTTYSLTGCVVGDNGGNESTLSVLNIQPNARVVLTRTLDTAVNGGVQGDGTFSFGLNNTGDSFVLTCAGQEIDRVDYTAAFGGGRATAISLDPSASNAVSNDDAANWCAATSSYYSGLNGPAEDNLGTPGTANPTCAAGPDVCDPNPCNTPPQGTCDGDTATTYDAVGTCSDVGGNAECSYASTPINCALSGRTCSAGVCVDGPSGDAPTAGQVIFTEIMFDPHFDLSDNSAEWFEVTNVSSVNLDLQGCSIAEDSGDDVVVNASLPIAPGTSVLFARSADSNGGLPYDLLFSFSLVNSGDSLTLACNGQVIDVVDYGADGFPSERARSISLDPIFNDLDGAELNDLGEAWCVGQTVYYSGANGAAEDNYGSPRSTNPSCP